MGHWITNDDGQHLYISDGGKVMATRSQISSVASGKERGKMLMAKSKAALAISRIRKSVPKPEGPIARQGPTARGYHMKQEEAHGEAKKLFGEKATANDFARAVGAGVKDKVSVWKNPTSGQVGVTLQSKHYTATRYFGKENGKTFIRNEEINVKEAARGRGLATALLARQKTEATKLGVEKLVATAARSEKYGGYYALPRMGYDAPIEARTRATLPSSLKPARTVQDLMKTQEGRDWWKEHGHGIAKAEIKLGQSPATARAVEHARVAAAAAGGGRRRPAK